MSDLISRSRLLEKLNDTGVQITFDLPVEEILGEDVDIDDFAMLAQDAIQVYRKMVIGTIEEQPTAYDVNKVVERLPCKIGDVAWAIRHYRGATYAQKGFLNEMFFTKEMKLCIVVKNIARGEFGKTVFLTKEEAEQALEEMKGAKG